MWTEVKYKCTCMKDEVALNVLQRGDGEHINAFMERVRRAVSGSHKSKSFTCTMMVTEYIELEHDNGTVGRPPKR